MFPRRWVSQTSMLMCFCASLMMCGVASAAEIAASDIAPPASTDYGVEETKLIAKPNFEGMNPEQISALMDGFPKQFQTIYIKDLWAALLLAPLNADEASVFPKDWSGLRFALLRKLGDIKRLDALLASVPDSLSNAWTEKERVRRMVASANVAGACDTVHHHVEALKLDEALNGFWALMQAACLRHEGKTDQADLALSIINELDAKQVTPLALALVSDDASAKKPLPPLTIADGRAGDTLLLAGLVDESRREGLLARVGASFVDSVDIGSMSAELARELANASKLSPEKRVLLAEHALIQGVSPSVVLRTLYQSLSIKADGGKIKDSDALRRARSYARIAAIPDMATRARAIADALPEFSAALGLAHADELFSDMYDQMATSVDAPKMLPPSLAQRIAFYYLSHSLRPSAAAMTKNYKKAVTESSDFTLKATYAVLAQALTLHDAATEGGSPDSVDLPVPPSPAMINTSLVRVAVVMNALGYDVPKALLVTQQAGEAPSDKSALLAQMHTAAQGDNAAMTLAYAMRLLSVNAVDVLTNNELAQTIADLKAVGLEKAAYALARDGVLVSK